MLRGEQSTAVLAAGRTAAVLPGNPCLKAWDAFNFTAFNRKTAFANLPANNLQFSFCS